MLFNTPDFVVFFILLAVVIYALNTLAQYRMRNLLLLCASYCFYANLNLYYPLLLVYITLINYFGGHLLVKQGLTAGIKKWLISLIVILSLLPLITFKYAPLYTDSIWLPVGLSFFTFQALTYTLDIYRNKIEKPFSLLNVGLFIAFFPTLLSGPIERARNLIPQLQQKFPINWDNIVVGSQHFAWGLFKKIVIADRLAEWVNTIYAGGASHTGGTLALAAILYSFQIYCDFSGYASMALGSGRMLGIRLMDNFQFPYFASSVKDFWRRWHISLTSWFTEYVYISMGGNRVSKARWILNITAVFLLSGIWHGATISFIIWGAIHAIMYLAEHFCSFKDKWGIYRIVVFAGVTLAWMFFRIADTALVIDMLEKIFCGPWFPIKFGTKLAPAAAATMGLLLAFILVELALYRGIIIKNKACKIALFSLLLVTISLFATSSDQFVYFKF